MTGAVELPPGLGVMLIVIGGACAYAAFFWESTKKVLSPEAQDAHRAVCPEPDNLVWDAIFGLADRGHVAIH